ncbi:MAG: hypothetical protein RJB08_754 [Actinomycetota bacterium]
MKTLNRQIGWLAVGQSAVRGAQVIAVLALVHVINPSEWNTLALAFSIYFVGITVGSLNLEHSVLTFLPRIEHRQYRMFLVQTRRFLFVAAAVTAVLVFVAQITFGFMGGLFSVTFLASAILFEIPAVIGGPVYIARGLHRAAAMWDLASAFGFLVCVFLPAVLIGSATSVLFGLAIHGAVRLVAFAFVVRGVNDEQINVPIANLARTQIAFCAPLGISLALGTLTRAVDKWIVAWQLPSSIGAYTVAAQEIPLLAVLPYAGGAAVTASLVRHLANNDTHSACHSWREQAESLCIPVVSLSVGIALVAPELFAVAVPHSPSGAATSFAIFSFIGIHRVTEYGVVLRAANQNKRIVESAAIVLIGCIIFGLIGVRIGGLVGISLGTALAFGIGWIAILRRISSVFGSRIRDVFPWVTWFRAINASLAGFVGATVIAHAFENTVARCALKIGVFVVVVRAVHTAGAEQRIVLRTPASPRPGTAQ